MNDTAPLSVPVADEQGVTYYGLPSVKPSLCGGLVSGYMFVAGVGGSAQIIASVADLVGDPALARIVRNGRYIALGATVLGGPLLIIDLHTPQRWYNMLAHLPQDLSNVDRYLGADEFRVVERGPRCRAICRRSRSLPQPGRAEGDQAIANSRGAHRNGDEHLHGRAIVGHEHATLGRRTASDRRRVRRFGNGVSAAALTIATLRRSASDNTGQALDLIGLTASTLELFLLLSLRQRFLEQGVDGALSESGWGLAYDLGAVAIGAGVPHHVESMIKPKLPSRPALVIPLAVLAGGFLLRHVLLRAGNVSAKRPKDYFRFTGRVPR